MKYIIYILLATTYLIGCMTYLVGCNDKSPDVIRNQMKSEEYCSGRCKEIQKDMNKETSYTFFYGCQCKDEVKK